MNKKLLMFALPILAIVLVSAGIMAYYGQVKSTVDVNQPISFFVGENGHDYIGDQAAENVDCDAGETCIGPNAYKVVNGGDSDKTVSLATSGDVGNGVDVSYYEFLGYNEEFLAEDTNLNGTNVTVEDLGDSVLWTMNVPLDGTYGTGLGPGGQAAWSISIGSGNDILYQVHSNDGTDGNYDDGTYLYSEYDNRWQTGSSNTPISEIDGIEATGNRTAADTGGIYTIKIDKDLLDLEEFKWVAYINYELDSLPNAFSWNDTDTGDFKTANVGTELTSPFIVPAGSFIEFYPQFNVDSMATEGDYVIYTTVNPAE